MLRLDMEVSSHGAYINFAWPRQTIQVWVQG